MMGRKIYIPIFVLALLLKLVADCMAWRCKLGVPGAAFSHIAAVLLLICSLRSFLVGLCIADGMFVNGLLYLRIIKKVLDHSDGSNLDPWLSAGVWIWFFFGTVCFVVTLGLYIQDRREDKGRSA